ncbi:MAG: hypothetical protein HFJ12_03960 [Bacilli bacterium]|nr:hypothetical protein [Bacilli bacterium]
MKNTQLKEYDTNLHLAIYRYPGSGDAQKLWKEILLEQDNKGLLREAIKPITNKRGESIIQAPTICDCILKDYTKVDETIYQELVNCIYTFPTIARTKAGGVFSKSNSSFLVQTLQNHDLVLNERQKLSAVTEALSMPGAIFSDDSGTKRKDILEVHGTTPFDIRYEILMNPNWTIEEKSNLVYDFYEKVEYFNEAICTWEKDIINNSSFYSLNGFQVMNVNKLYCYSEEELSQYYPNEEKRENIKEEIRMYELFHQMRPCEVTTENHGERAHQKRYTLPVQH